MSALQGMGLTAALLAASGGVAIATWRYISARRRKGAEPDTKPVQDVGDGDKDADPSPVQKIDNGAQSHSLTTRKRDKRADPDLSSLPEGYKRADTSTSQKECKRAGTSTLQEECKRANTPTLQEECKRANTPTSQEECRRANTSALQEERKRAQTSASQEECKRADPSASQEECKRADPSASQEECKRADPSASQEECKRADPSSSQEECKSADPSASQEECKSADPSASQEECKRADPSASQEECKRADPSASQEECKSADPSASQEEYKSADPSASQEEYKRADPSASQEECKRADPSASQEEYKRADPSASQEECKTADPSASQEECKRADPSASQEECKRADPSASQEECKRAVPDTSAILHQGEKRADSDRSPMEREMSCTKSSTEIQFKGKTTQVLLLGLDGSGKTSVLNSIAANKGKLITTPTEGVNAMCVSNGNTKMEFLEIGGSEQLRPYWKMYLGRAFAVIFVVDAADHDRLPLAKRHLHQLIQQDSVLPLIVLANKQDLQNAYHITEIHDALALSEICENRKLFLIGTHVTQDGSALSSGIQDTKEYLAQLLAENSAKIT